MVRPLPMAYLAWFLLVFVIECARQSRLLNSAIPFQGRWSASCSFSKTLFLNSGAALCARTWSHLTDSPQLWEINNSPRNALSRQGDREAWCLWFAAAGVLGALEILRRAISIWKMKKIRGERCYFLLPSNIKRVCILKVALPGLLAYFWSSRRSQESET